MTLRHTHISETSQSTNTSASTTVAASAGSPPSAASWPWWEEAARLDKWTQKSSGLVITVQIQYVQKKKAISWSVYPKLYPNPLKNLRNFVLCVPNGIVLKPKRQQVTWFGVQERSTWHMDINTLHHLHMKYLPLSCLHANCKWIGFRNLHREPSPFYLQL